MTATTGDGLLSDYLARLDTAAQRLPLDRRAELMEGIAEHIAAARASGELRDEAAVRTLIDRLGEPEEIVAAATEDAYGGAPPAWGAPAPAPLVPRQPGTGLELAAVLMLTVGSLLPVVGWLVGVALLWSSPRWRTREKVLGTLVVPGGPGILVLPLTGLALTSGEVCTASFGGATGGGEGPALEIPGGPPSSGPGQPPPFEPPQFEPPQFEPPQFEPPPPGAGSFTETTTTCESTALLPTSVAIPLGVVVLVAPVVVAVLLLRRARARAAAEPPVLGPAGASPWSGLEVAAVLVLALGSFVVPFVGSLVGLVLVWVAPRWTPVDKGVATVLTLLPAGLVLLAFAGGPLVLPFGLFAAAVFAVFGQLFAAGYLALVLSRR